MSAHLDPVVAETLSVAVLGVVTVLLWGLVSGVALALYHLTGQFPGELRYLSAFVVVGAVTVPLSATTAGDPWAGLAWVAIGLAYPPLTISALSVLFTRGGSWLDVAGITGIVWGVSTAGAVVLVGLVYGASMAVDAVGWSVPSVVLAVLGLGAVVLLPNVGGAALARSIARRGRS